jgi:predicted NACHT family NTPase
MYDALTRISDEGWRRHVDQVVIEQLRERNFILCHLSGDFFAFVHRGFLEYFCTEEICNLVAREPSTAVEQLKEIFTQHCREDVWSEVLTLTANALESIVADEVLAPLVASEADEELRPLWIACRVLTGARDPSALAKTARATRDKLEGLLRSKTNGWHGRQAISALASLWPDEATRQVLTSVAQNNASGFAGQEAVQLLAEHWPDEATRQVLTSVAQNNPGSRAGRKAVQLLPSIGPMRRRARVRHGG